MHVNDVIAKMVRYQGNDACWNDGYQEASTHVIYAEAMCHMFWAWVFVLAKQPEQGIVDQSGKWKLADTISYAHYVFQQPIETIKYLGRQWPSIMMQEQWHEYVLFYF